MHQSPEDLAREVASHSWYHTIDLGGGVVTPGMFDHRPMVDRYLIPGDLSGARCLDVGTMDGFWAFEMERRGAEVVASDVGKVDDLDWPPRWRTLVIPTLDETKQARFRLAQRTLGSEVKYVESSVYELSPDAVGEFDLVFCGDLLVHLKDPITAVQRMRSVCRGSVIVCNPVKRFRFGRRRALAEFDGINEFRWWLLSEASIKRMMVAVGCDGVDVGPQFDLPPREGGSWRGRRCVIRGYVR